MTYCAARPSVPFLVVVALFALFCEGAFGEVIVLTPPDPPFLPVGGPIGPVPYQTIHTITRLTTNTVADANPMIADGFIYWERFGGDQGDTEIFSFHTRNDRKKNRRTSNFRQDTLQAPGVWISAPITPLPRDEDGLIDTSAYNDPKFRRLSNHNTRRTEVFAGYNTRVTKNRRQERSVQLSDIFMDGMVWLSRKVPRQANGGIFLVNQRGYDVFWFNRATRQTTRINGPSRATSLAFGGSWAVWTSPGSGSFGSVVQDTLTLRNVRTGETRVVDAEGPLGLQVTDQYVMYGTSAGNINPDADLGGVSFLTNFENRVMLYDIAADTTIEVGADDALGYHRDMDAVLSDQYVAYNRSFQDPTPIPIYPPVTLPPDITELRLYNIDTLSDILITEGRDIAGLQIDDRTLVWEMLDTSDPLEENWDIEIYAYDMLTKEIRQVTDNLVDDRGPQIEDNIIVWTTYLENGQTEIYYETTSTVTLGSLILPTEFTPIPGDPSEFVTVVTVPEPASLVLLSLAGMLTLGRGRSARKAGGSD